MKNLTFKKIDAFATEKSRGNPAGYIQLSSIKELNNLEMLMIAKELKGYVNEVGFVEQKSEKSFQLKFYSSEREVDFCGHATVAILNDIIQNNETLHDLSTLFIETNIGIQKVINNVKDENSVFIYAPEPTYYDSTPDINAICNAMQTPQTAILQSLPIEVIHAGLKSLIIPIKNLSFILQIAPDINMLKDFCIHHAIDIIVVFTEEVYNSNNNYRVRVFAPTFGYLEDPATGSGNSALGYYLLKHNNTVRETIYIEQNNSKESYNIIKLKIIKENDSKKVLFGGSAITRIEGTYFLY